MQPMNKAKAKAIRRREFLRTLGGAAAIAGVTGPFDYARAAISPGEKGIYITAIYRTKTSLNSSGYTIRMETNKGITGWGECRDLDSGSLTGLNKYCPLIIGMNPTQVDKVYNTMLTQYTAPSDMANQELNGTGAISAIEMACWDILGKVYNMPVYKLLGRKLRDKIRMYADTDNNQSSAIQSRIAKGFTWFKTDMYLDNIAQSGHTHASSTNSYGYRPITISQSGLDSMAAYMQAYRNVLKAAGEPYASAPIGSDHYQSYNAGNNQLSVESAIALANVLKPISNGAWAEDIIDWYFNDGNGVPVIKQVTDGTDMNIGTGEDMFTFPEFKAYADVHACDVFHPEPNTAGGLHPTLLAATYGYTKGIKTAFHNSSGPLAMAAYAHIAACVPEFLAMEFHHMDVSYHDDLIDGIPKPLIQNGYMTVPEGPGLGVWPNQTAYSAHGGSTWTKVA